MRKTLLFIFSIVVFSCTKDTLPKPAAFLSLTYPKKSYEKLVLKRPYFFEVLKNTVVVDEANNWLKIKYPRLKAAFYLRWQ